MTFEEWFETKDYHHFYMAKDAAQSAWEASKQEILNLLEQNKELEAVSYGGKKVYKIYGNVIDKIKEL